MTTTNVADMRFGCKILLYRNHLPVDGECVYYQKDFPFQIFSKWQWYFRYRAALIQVANPKRLVELSTFSYEYVPTYEEKRKRMKDKLTAKRGKLTQWRNEFRRVCDSWNSLFPVEQDPRYRATVDKIDSVAAELDRMEREYKQFTLLEEA